MKIVDDVYKKIVKSEAVSDMEKYELSEQIVSMVKENDVGYNHLIKELLLQISKMVEDRNYNPDVQSVSRMMKNIGYKLD